MAETVKWNPHAEWVLQHTSLPCVDSQPDMTNVVGSICVIDRGVDYGVLFIAPSIICDASEGK